MEDALVLVQCLRDIDDPARAFTRFEALRRPRLDAIAKAAKRNSNNQALGPSLPGSVIGSCRPRSGHVSGDRDRWHGRHAGRSLVGASDAVGRAECAGSDSPFTRRYRDRPAPPLPLAFAR
jgi:hypothetical protein